MSGKSIKSTEGNLMVTTQAQFRQQQVGCRNIVKHGDTDIFPFSFESLLLFDLQDEFRSHCRIRMKILMTISPDSKKCQPIDPLLVILISLPMQTDPIWNAHFLCISTSYFQRR